MIREEDDTMPGLSINNKRYVRKDVYAHRNSEFKLPYPNNYSFQSNSKTKSKTLKKETI